MLHTLKRRECLLVGVWQQLTVGEPAASCPLASIGMGVDLPSAVERWLGHPLNHVDHHLHALGGGIQVPNGLHILVNEGLEATPGSNH